MGTEKPDLELCDIVVFNGRAWLSRAIRRLTTEPGEEASFANHTGFIVEEGWFYTATLQEAVIKVVRRTLAAYHEKGAKARIYRPKNLSQRDKFEILDAALETLGRRYGYGKLPLAALDWALGQVRRKDVYFFRRFGFTSRPICSWDVARAWGRAGYGFGVPYGQATPDDIDDFCRERDDLYDLVYEGDL